MIECDKQYNEYKVELYKVGLSHPLVSKADYKAGYRAALEWVLTHKKPIKYKDYKFDYIKTDVIEEELNAKT